MASSSSRWRFFRLTVTEARVLGLMAVVLVGGAGWVLAQQTPAVPGGGTSNPAQQGARPSVRPLWRGQFPGGTYVVDVRNVVSVSVHDFVVDKVMKVTEVTVATTGSVEARFYYVEPNVPSLPAGGTVLDSVRDKTTQGLDRITGGQATAMATEVIKSYPLSTHAHTVEYRLGSRGEAQEVFKSIEAAWRDQRSGSYGGAPTQDGAATQ